MEELVSTNIIRPPSLSNKLSQNDVMVPYRLQCALIRIFVELYPEVRSLDLNQPSQVQNINQLFLSNNSCTTLLPTRIF